MTEPLNDSTATAELLVAARDLASALPFDATDAFPAVFATARMVALMEIACARVLRECLSLGQLSVGVSIEATQTRDDP